MIIAINGRIGSGKDTLAKLIKRNELIGLVQKGLLSFHSVPSLNKLDSWNCDYSNSAWEIKKFAGKLKLMLSLLTGIPVEKFEDQDFKKNYVINLKTFIVHQKEIVPYYFDQDKKDLVINFIKQGNHDIFITIRLLLQLFGTEIIRYWMPLAWINATFCDYDGSKNWLITDLRFPNEFDSSKEKGAITVRIERGDIKLNDPDLHESETGLDSYRDKFDYIIKNDSTLEDLEMKVGKLILSLS